MRNFKRHKDGTLGGFGECDKFPSLDKCAICNQASALHFLNEAAVFVSRIPNSEASKTSSDVHDIWLRVQNMIFDKPVLKNYVCPQCGEDSNGSEIHALTHHTLPPLTVDEAKEKLKGGAS